MAKKEKKTDAKAPAKGKGGDKKVELMDDASLKRESKFVLDELKMVGGSWYMKLTLRETLSDMHQVYGALFQYDVKPMEERIEQIKRELESGMFAEEPGQQRAAEKQIQDIRNSLAKELSASKDVEGNITVLAMKYVDKGTQVSVLIPQAMAFSLAEQYLRLGKFKVTIDPIFS